MASRRNILTKLTRREWTTLFAASPLLAQSTPSTSAQPVPNATGPKGVADVQQISQRLAEIEVPVDVEPSFHFVA